MVSGTNKNKYKKPNFLIVGAAKSGTTSLAMYLNQHPDIYIPKQKEPRFFAKDTLINTSDEDPLKEHILKTSIFNEEEYFKSYDVKESLACDASVHYLYHHDEVIPKIKYYLGDVPIIVILRNPVDRAISNYKYNKILHNNSLSKELELELTRKKNNFNSFWYYKDLGLYHSQIQPYLNNFSSVKVIVFENFINDIDNYCKDIFHWLGVNNIKIDKKVYNNSVTEKNILKSFKKSSFYTLLKFVLPVDNMGKRYFRNILYKDHDLNISDSFKNNLLEYFYEDIEKTENIINKNLSIWKNKY